MSREQDKWKYSAMTFRGWKSQCLRIDRRLNTIMQENGRMRILTTTGSRESGPEDAWNEQSSTAGEMVYGKYVSK